jgi:hypothetical protein
VWTTPTPPAGYSKTYARITVSAYNPTNHSPCLWLRREYFDFNGTNQWLKMPGDKDLQVGCFNLSTRTAYPASATVWAPWWSTPLSIVTSQGGLHQRLLVSTESNWPTEAAGAQTSIFYAVSIELYASNSAVVQGALPNGSGLSTGAATGTPLPSSTTVIKAMP